MENYTNIELIERLNGRLRVMLPNLDAVLARAVRVDYRTASPARLQEILAEVMLNMDADNQADLREIQKKITAAEQIGNPARGGRREAAWLVQEPSGHPMAGVPLTPQQAQSFRYAGLPGGAGPGAALPSRLAEELSAATGAGQAKDIVQRKLPALKGQTAWQFLAAIGYPAAVPSDHAVRLAGFTGLIAANVSGGREEYLSALLQTSHDTGQPLAELGMLFQLYADPDVKPTKDWVTICKPRRPLCGECNLTDRCRYFAEQEAARAEGDPEADYRRVPVKDWLPDERPRERMMAGERLSNSELLAVILRTGSGRLSAVELARELIRTFGTLHELDKATPQEIVERMRGRGIGPAKAVEICAALELGRRVTQPAADTRLGLPLISSSREVFQLCRARYKAATQEEFLLLVMNTKNRVQKEIAVSLGTLNSSIVHPRDVFRHAIKESAAAVIFVHNHPSGDPTPSQEDILLTARLVDAGKLVGIQVLDHVIIGSHEFYSFSDHGRLK